jgi:phospholipase D-like protein
VFIRILIAAAVILFLVLWVRAVIDVYRRGDLNTGQKAAWALIMLILPFIGLLIYTMLRPGDAQVTERPRR